MREHILIDGGRTHRIGINGKGQLALSSAENGNIVSSVTLTSHKSEIFSADIDSSGVLHVVCITAGTLTYLRVSDGRTSSTQLMRLPEKFSVTSVAVEADTDIRLYYSVKSREGCAVIEYTLSNDTWKGKNLCTSEYELSVCAVKKREPRCFAVKKTESEYILFNAFEPDEILFSSHLPIEYVQSVSSGTVFACAGSVFFGENEIARGNAVFVLDGNRVLVRGDTLKEMNLFGGGSCDVALPRGAREYVLCKPETDKRLILSSPFPYIKTEFVKNPSGGILQEVYMQQRAIFTLQAEIKALKARISKLEEISRCSVNKK